jgi:LCP family protein required for cell wall assembly
VGDDTWDQPRQGDLTGPPPAPTDQPARRPMPAVPPGAADPTEVIEGAGHFDGVEFDDAPEHVSPFEPTEAMAPAPPPAPVAARGRQRGTQRGRQRGRGRRIAAAGGYTILGLVSLLVLGLTGYAWGQYTNLDTGIHKSDALISPEEKKSLNGDTNILIMDLDSRLDENGRPLPQNIYDALHAGDNSEGGYNANVLMLLHVPAHGQAVEISIPRDDYVALPGCPDGVCHEKIKQAYGLARDEAYNKLRRQGMTGVALEQAARDAGRKEEAETVSQFLGGVPIDHFVEVTLVAFFQIAQVVQPVTVCVLKPTRDTFSGANFRAGMQQINAAQALAYVRQRRDNVRGDFYFNDFTDLDRERRQQAFISALAYQLRQAGTFANPAKLSGILDVAKANTAIDSGLDLLQLAQEASNLTGGQITFNTLPVERFADLGGSIGDVNIVNLPIIQAEVRELLGTATTPTTGAPATATAPPSTSGAPPPTAGVVDVVNRSGQQGMAAKVAQALAGKGYRQGGTSSGTSESLTVVEYGSSGARGAAQAIASLLGVRAEKSTAAGTGRVRVVLGTDFTLPAALGGTPATVDTRSEAPGSNANAPSPLAGGSIPCVK